MKNDDPNKKNSSILEISYVLINQKENNKHKVI